MFQKTIYDYMVTSMSPIKVFMEIPSKPPEKFVLIDVKGGKKTNHVCNSSIAIQSYAGSLFDACELNEQVKTAMEGSASSLDDVVSSSVNSDYQFTDVTTKKYRYQAIFDVVHY